ncbi:MAG: alanine racemase [Saprospiraceae bacterium]|jgi:alanine racemase
MKYSILHIQSIIGAQRLNEEGIESVIQHIIFDSRRVDFPQASLFIAFESVRNDGHQFIRDLYKKGVRNFLVSKRIAPEAYPQTNFLLVPDTLKALQELALYHRQQFHFPVIGITGSNGKTIVKEWLFQLLEVDYTITRSPRSFNSQIGVPLSVLQIEAQHNLGIFEAGISKIGEMENLQSIINCSIGIFTNIGQAHSEGFKDQEQKIHEKLPLFKETDTIIYCKDHKAIDCALGELKHKKLVSWSRRQKTDLQIINEKITAKGITKISANFNNKMLIIEIPFSDAASVENAIHCWLTMLVLGVDESRIKVRMSTLHALAMRLELKAGINDSTLINDSYNSDLTSLSFALGFLEQQSGQLSRTVILSDILQSGQSPEKLYQEVGHLLEDNLITKVIGIGEEIKLLDTFCKADKKIFFKSTQDFLANYNTQNFQKEIILLKGARDFEFEKIANRLARKNHNTTLEVDLNALTHNLNVFKQLLDPGTQLMVMVKAAAYGSGSDEVARLLQFQKVDYLAVAYADEGVELRKAGISTPIMVLNPEKATFDTILGYQLEPEIYSLNLLDQFLRYLRPGQEATIHIKVDTGMHRLGFEPQDLEALVLILKRNPNLKAGSIFSHLSASDEAVHDDFSQQQFALFQEMAEEISAHLGYQPLRHILNSSGIIRFPQYQLDMVRLGIGIYGIDVNDLLQTKLQTVLSLKASISQIKVVQEGETIGYSRKGKAVSDLRIATISIGYADGLLRKAGNGRYAVLIHGKQAPIIGNVCMDMTMVDISQIPEASEGDEVSIFGKDHPVEDLAKCYESLTYEVFTGISGRVKRVYFQD